MRRRSIALGLLVVGFVPPAGSAWAEGPAPWQGPANAWIAAHAMRVRGQAPKDRRLSCEGDLNGDGTADIVVVYTIVGAGGADDWTQHATVLAGSAQQFVATPPVQVGAHGERTVESCTVASGVIAVVAKDGTRRYRFEKGTLAEVPASAGSAS